MSAGHSHSHSAAGRHRWRLLVAFTLTVAFFVLELVAGILARSLSLISDAGHMAADVVTLGAALGATRIATRPDRTGRRTFGSYRVEVFASGLAVLMMLGVAVYIASEAVQRIGAPAQPAVGVMLVVGGLGLLINLVALGLLRGGSEESLTVKGAYLEVLADALGSVGVMAAAVVVHQTGDGMWDTVIALLIALFVGVRAVILGREVLTVLAQHAPEDIEPSEMLAALEGVAGVREVHDLHVWTLTSGMVVATAHLVTDGQADPLDEATSLLRDRFGIAHATLQVETTSRPGCVSADW